MIPLQKVTITRTAAGLTLNNPTPYHITVGYIGTNGKTLMPGADSIMVAPFTSATQHLSSLPSTFQLGFTAGWRCLKSNVIPSNPSAKALLLRRGKYDYAFSFTGDSLPVF